MPGVDGVAARSDVSPPVSIPQEPPKEDLTVSEKFQLVLDVAQKAQVRQEDGGARQARAVASEGKRCHSSRVLVSVPTESVWEDGEHPGEDQEVSFPGFFFFF